MTFSELISSITSLLTRTGSNRLSDEDIRTACLNIANYFATQIVDYLPSWTDELTFQTDGTDAGLYCTYPDTNGKKRIWESKIDDNLNHLPPNNPAITENAYWIEVSPSASSSIQEWAVGVFGPGLVVVYHNHSVDGRGFYVLLEPTRPFASADIEAEILTGKWERLGSASPFQGGHDATGDVFPADPTPGQEWYISNVGGADLDAGDGGGSQHWNQYAMIKYLAPGLWKIWQ
jgi:hypothetical protein